MLDPQITVTVVQARSRLVSILGFVNSPGRYELDGISAKISDVIAMAGGLDPNASDKIVLQPSGAGKGEPVIVDLSSIIQGDSSKNIEVRGGDSIFVPRAAVVYVYGEVQKGGAYRIEPDMTVMQAISLAGGITPRRREPGAASPQGKRRKMEAIQREAYRCGFAGRRDLRPRRPVLT